METKVEVFCFLLLTLMFSLSAGEVTRFTIRGENSTATTDDNFNCATLDWRPNEKFNYNQCPWRNTSILNLDLKNKIFMNAINALNPLRTRFGGSLQDLVVYDVGKADTDCPQLKLDKNGRFGFINGCLPHKKWDELDTLFNQTGIGNVRNVLYGTHASQQGILWVVAWDPHNARDLIKYTIEKGYKIDSCELGNELCGYGVAARLDGVQYGKDLSVLKDLVKELYPDASTRPKVLGPAGFYEENWFNTFLETIGPEVVHGVTHHIYNLGSGVDPNLISKIQDPFYLDHVAQTYEHVSRSVEKYAPMAGAWVGEGGGAYNSGGKNVRDRFVGGFWYLDQLGMTSTLNHKVYCRQALIGGNYGLLNTATSVPNPDYYGALLWHRLMGKQVLKTSHDGSPYLQAYSHCSRHRPGVTLLLINLSNSTSFDIVVAGDFNLHRKLFESRLPREEYHLTANNGDIQSDVMLLNASPLRLTNSSDIPRMEPVRVDSSSAISVAPQSFVLVVLDDVRAPACA